MRAEACTTRGMMNTSPRNPTPVSKPRLTLAVRAETSALTNAKPIETNDLTTRPTVGSRSCFPRPPPSYAVSCGTPETHCENSMQPWLMSPVHKATHESR